MTDAVIDPPQDRGTAGLSAPIRRAGYASAPKLIVVTLGASNINETMAGSGGWARRRASQKYLKFQHQPMCVN
jgi:hypothetical protein